MSRIGAGISGLEQYLLTHLQKLDNASLQSALRLATGKQVPRPSFDPSAFARISELESRLGVLESTKQQVDLAANIGAESQLIVEQVRSQLIIIREALLADEDQTLTTEQRAAHQSTIDAAIGTINELAGSDINGRRYLDGSTNFSFSGRDHNEIRDIQAIALRETTFSGSVTTAATQSVASYNGSGGEIKDNATFVLQGKRGAGAVSVTKDEDLNDVATRINSMSHKTGITARTQGNKLFFTTLDFGDDAFIDIDVTSGDFKTNTLSTGQDAVVTINGRLISNSQVDGNRVTYIENGTHVTFEFAEGFNGAFNPITVSDSGVAKFSLSPDISRQTNLALPSIQTAFLGGVSGRISDLTAGGALAGLDSNTSAAIRVVDEALGQLTLVEGRVDAFADVTVASSAKLLEGFTSEVKDALETLNGVNQDQESLILAKNQALATNTVAVLSLIQQQQFNLAGLVKLLAGI